MSINPPIADVVAMIHQRQRRLFVRVAEKMQESLVFGSDVTASPGQPQQTGDLRRSWQLTFPEEWHARSASGLEYAPAIEEGIGPYGKLTLRSVVGGFHSRALTRTGFQRLVDASVAEVLKGGGP
ncbi:MAG TPA: hypothetical protein VNA25_11285 [Phycisphaerae bacterium]|nr:hypothetical protein [Phycisphaerae bacterium]